MKKILVINGPNLNMLGKRNETHYGSLTLKNINELMQKEDYFDYTFFQSNSEGEIVTEIQLALNKFDGLIINPAAYTHTSVAIRDALLILDCPIVEVHLSEVDKREEFRQVNYIRDIVAASFKGKKEKSYTEAIKYLKKVLICDTI